VKVPFFRADLSSGPRREALEQHLRAAEAEGYAADGKVVATLEESLAEYTGARHVIAVGSGTDALTLLLHAVGVGPGDEVVVPAYTFFASASSVCHVGARPVFVDVLPGSYGMDPAAARAALTPRTAAIMPVHLFSQTADLPGLAEVAGSAGVPLVEDSAEAIGMRVGGRHAGLWGSGGVLSFFPTKTLGACGDAGAVLTDDDLVAARVRQAAGAGEWTSRCDAVQAAVLLARLPWLDADIAARQALAERYTARLAGIPPVSVPYLASVPVPGNAVWYVYLVECDERDALAAHLAAHGVETEVYYPRPLPAQPCFAPDPARVPVAARASTRALGLPLYPDLRPSEVDAVTDLIAEFYESR
jgi:dTDP-4-amino-4,6-dideoxygalactose transaminase